MIERGRELVAVEAKSAQTVAADFFTGLWDTIWGGMTTGFEAALAFILDGVDKIVGGFNNVKDFFGGLGDKLGFGDDDGGGQEASGPMGPGIVTQGDRVARTILESQTNSTAEVTIRDESGRAEVTGGTLGNGLNLQRSGAF